MISEESVQKLLKVPDVSRETLDRMEALVVLLARWTARINLVSSASLESVWERHVLDSAQLWPLGPRSFRRWVDLGSGAGFPGLIIAIIARGADPDAEIVLVESDTRKAAFLLAAVREVDVGARVVSERILDVSSLDADVLSARALAPLVDLLEMAKKHRRPDGICLFPKGRTVHKEVEAARSCWVFEPIAHPSLTDPTATVLEIGDFHRV